MASGTVAELAGIVDAGDFWKPNHAVIWQAITVQHEQGAPTDPAAVAVALAASNELGKVDYRN